MKKCRLPQGSPFLCKGKETGGALRRIGEAGGRRTFSVAASGSKNPDGKSDHWSTETVFTEEESEGVRLAVTERQEMNGVLTEVQPTNGAEGDIIMCEVEEQQVARVEVQGPKRRAVVRVE